HRCCEIGSYCNVQETKQQELFTQYSPLDLYRMFSKLFWVFCSLSSVLISRPLSHKLNKIN
ncbi:mCG1033011, partial [Mus musculus]